MPNCPRSSTGSSSIVAASWRHALAGQTPHAPGGRLAQRGRRLRRYPGSHLYRLVLVPPLDTPSGVAVMELHIVCTAAARWVHGRAVH